MSLIPELDDDGLLEYSVVYSDRALNHMSKKFIGVMQDISGLLKEAYNAHSAVVMPGSGSYGMEAVARQFGTNKKCMVLRNGWFSYRWTQIFDMGSIPSEVIIHKARRIEGGSDLPASFEPCPLAEVLASIATEKPDVFFAPHVETSAGMMLPNEYIRAVADAVHDAGGIFVLDCIASGAIWINMKESGVDCLISAPQKGWSGPACCAFVTMSELARQRINDTTSTSFCCDLKKWVGMMETYEKGGHGYHATMPTDALVKVRDVMQEAKAYGFDRLKGEQFALGAAMRAMLTERKIKSVAAPGYEAPGVVVCFTEDVNLHNSKAMSAVGIQIAAGVPLMVDEGPDYRTFRLGLFGLEKMHNIERTVETLKKAFIAANY